MGTSVCGLLVTRGPITCTTPRYASLHSSYKLFLCTKDACTYITSCRGNPVHPAYPPAPSVVHDREKIPSPFPSTTHHPGSEGCVRRAVPRGDRRGDRGRLDTTCPLASQQVRRGVPVHGQAAADLEGLLGVRPIPLDSPDHGCKMHTGCS